MRPGGRRCSASVTRVASGRADLWPGTGLQSHCLASWIPRARGPAALAPLCAGKQGWVWAHGLLGNAPRRRALLGTFAPKACDDRGTQSLLGGQL